jgi:hypothetical protein
VKNCKDKALELYGKATLEMCGVGKVVTIDYADWKLLTTTTSWNYLRVANG